MSHPVHSVPDVEKISDKPVTEDNFRELKDSIDKFNEMAGEAAAAKINAFNSRLEELSDAVNRLDKNADINLRALFELGSTDVKERSQQSAAEVAALDGINKTLKNVFEHIKSEDAKDSAEFFNKKELKCAIAVGAITGLSTLVALGAWVTQIVQTVQAAQGNQPPPQTGDPSLDSKLADLYSFIKGTSDDEFWSQLAIFVGMQRSWTLYLTDQMAMMNYVTDWFPNYGEWVWASGHDKLGLVTQLVTAYKTSNSAIYTTVNGFTYAGDAAQPGVAVTLPRAVGADLVRLALAQIIAQANNIK